MRERAQQLYEERGHVEGQALSDWVQAETEILGNTMIAPLYRRVKASALILPRDSDGREDRVASDLSHDSEPACETA